MNVDYDEMLPNDRFAVAHQNSLAKCLKPIIKYSKQKREALN